uniref:CRISPR locus-related DNA-binding protein n=1 Tax=Archaeoglobus fulgidus TaxID=2234 RepID=A0A7C3MAT2_ARCFL
MVSFVHVISVESNSSEIVESVKMCGQAIHKAYLIFDKDEARKYVDEVRNVLSSLVEVEVLELKGGGVYDAVVEILRTVRKEVEAGNNVLFNITDSSKFTCLACFISAQISEGKIYAKKGSSVVEIPTPPIKKVNEDKLEILRALEKEGGSVDSINRLIELVEGKLEEQKKYMAQRARMSYHLNGLEEDGLVVTERKGKNLSIFLTELGKAFVAMFG